MSTNIQAPPKKKPSGAGNIVKGLLILIPLIAWLVFAVMYWNMKDPFSRVTNCWYLDWLFQRLDPNYFSAISIYLHFAPLLLMSYILTVMIPDTVKKQGHAVSVVYGIFATILMIATVLMAICVCTYLPDYAKTVLSENVVNTMISVSDQVYLWLTPAGLLVAFPIALIQGVTKKKPGALGAGFLIAIFSLLSGFIIAAACCLILVVMQTMLPSAVETIETFCRTMASSSSMMLIGLCLAPLIEETAFRGLFQNHLDDYLGAVIAVLLASIAFGIWHRSVGQFVYTFFMGLFTGSLYRVTGRLRYPVLLHFAFNFAVILAYSDTPGCLLPSIPWLPGAMVNARVWLFGLVPWKAVLGLILAAGAAGAGIGLISVKNK